MLDLLSPFAPLHPWLLERSARNLRVVRDPDDPYSLQHTGQEVEISSYLASQDTTLDIMLCRRDGPADDRWVGWRRSANYRADCTHFATRAVIVRLLHDLGFEGVGWAAGHPWSSLTDEQAGRVVAEMVRRIGSDPRAAAHLPVGVLGLPSDSITDRLGWWGRRRTQLAGEGGACSWFRDDCHDQQKEGWRFEIYKTPYGAEKIDLSGPDFGDDGQRLAEKAAQMHGYLLVEQVTPPEKG